MSGRIDPRRFLIEHLPARFNRLLGEEAGGDAGRAALGELAATVRVDLAGEGGGTFYLNIEAGHMSGGEAPARPPFVTFVQELADFERLLGEMEQEPLALISTLPGLAGPAPLTESRVERIASVRGTLRVDVTGEAGFGVLVHLGGVAPPAEPDARIRVDAETFRELREGRLEPQAAFLAGRVQLEGDVALVMQLALAGLMGP